MASFFNRMLDKLDTALETFNGAVDVKEEEEEDEEEEEQEDDEEKEGEEEMEGEEDDEEEDDEDEGRTDGHVVKRSDAQGRSSSSIRTGRYQEIAYITNSTGGRRVRDHATSSRRRGGGEGAAAAAAAAAGGAGAGG
eukprot:evm.model.NODE_36220_length_14683_cov_23.009193.1